MGGVVQKVTGALGLTADPSTGSAQVAQANQLQERAVRELEKLGVPSIEAQRLVLEEPALVLSTLEERLGKSAMEDILVDSGLQEAELDALAALRQAGEEGFVDEDRARIAALKDQVASDEKARQASILQQMAQRGALDSGAQLAAQLGSSQAATQRAAQEGLQLAAQQAAARRSALGQAAQLAANLQNRQFQQGSQVAQAKDRIAAFNANVASQDTAARRQQEQQRAALRNQQEMYNKGLIQQQFQNELAKATGIAGGLGNQAQQAMQSAAMQASAAQQAAAGTRGLLLGGAKAAIGPGGLKDGGIKGKAYQDGGIPDSMLGMEDQGIPYPRIPQYTDNDPLNNILNDLDVVGAPDPSNPLLQTQAPLQRGLTQEKLANIENNQLQAEKGIELAKERRSEDKPAKKKNKLAQMLSDFEEGYKDGVGDPVPRMQVGNINPNDIARMIASTQQKAPSPLDKIRQQIMSAKDGGTKGMNYEAGGAGTIIDSGEESYAGDELADRINDGEMVLNLDQQDELVDLLQELAERRRGDEMVDAGRAEVDEDQQQTLMDIARGEAMPEDLDPEEDIVKESTVNDFESLLNELSAYQDGGIGQSSLDLDAITRLLQGESEPNMSVDPALIAEQMDSTDQPIDYSKMMSVGEPAEIPVDMPEETTEETKSSPSVKKQETQKKTTKSSSKKKTDEELSDARRRDTLVNLLQDIDSALSHYDAANPNAILKPIQKDYKQSNFEQQLRQARQIAENEAYKQRQLDLQEMSQKMAAEDRALRRQDREERMKDRQSKESRLMRKDQLNAARGLLKDDPRFKKAVEQGMEFESVDRLLDQAKNGNQAALAALGTKLARAMGEVGVLTDTDVVRYVGGTSWGRKMKDWFAKGAKGELSEDTLKDMRENLGMLKSKLKEDVSRVYSNAEGRMKTAYPDLENTTIKGLLGAPMVSKEGSKASSGDTVAVRRKKDGAVRLVPKDKLSAVLKDPNYEEVK